MSVEMLRVTKRTVLTALQTAFGLLNMCRVTVKGTLYPALFSLGSTLVLPRKILPHRRTIKYPDNCSGAYHIKYLYSYRKALASSKPGKHRTTPCLNNQVSGVARETEYSKPRILRVCTLAILGLNYHNICKWEIKLMRKVANVGHGSLMSFSEEYGFKPPLRRSLCKNTEQLLRTLWLLNACRMVTCSLLSYWCIKQSSYDYVLQ